MPFEIPDGLNPAVNRLAWLVGRWEGTGKGVYPDTEEFDFGQQVDFAHNGGDFLHYLSQTFEVDAEGKAIRPLSMETGFWRPQPDLAPRVATVRVLQQVGERRMVVSHFNKATKGRIVRALLEHGADPRTPAALAGTVRDLGWAVEEHDQGARGTRLDVVVRAL